LLTQITDLGPILTRRVSEGSGMMVAAATKVGPSLTRRAVINFATRP
jgi:hypothetical protein